MGSSQFNPDEAEVALGRTKSTSLQVWKHPEGRSALHRVVEETKVQATFASQPQGPDGFDQFQNALVKGHRNLHRFGNGNR